MSVPVLEMRAISKRFAGVQALDEVYFKVERGEIVCLLGENGAGKSTLMKILTGVYRPDSGQILFEGEEVRCKSTKESFGLGIQIVFQELSLCPNLTAMENLFLGQELSNSCGLLDAGDMRKAAEAAFAQLRVRIDPDALVKNLGIAQQQMIEIAKALTRGTKLLILDEPTSTLPDEGVRTLFTIVRELKQRGVSVVFISHRLEEVLAISDRIVCLKDGKNSGEIETKAAGRDRLIMMMVGRNLDGSERRAGEPSKDVALEAQGLSRPPRVREVSFILRRGEVLGLAGLIGAGRTELARLLIGADQPTTGRIILEKREIQVRHPADAVTHRIGYVPEDRKRLGLILGMSLRENSTMTVHPQIRNRFGLIRKATESSMADAAIRQLQIRARNREQRVRQLSGGNQQKVVLAKWLAIKPKVLILDEPTRGIDVGAKAEVHRLIWELADSGVAILLISSELPEVLKLADRVLVMRQGKLTGEFPRSQATEEAIMRAALSP
jgi:ABC-type sugar transport system ATPase subunit